LHLLDDDAFLGVPNQFAVDERIPNCSIPLPLR
jgi:hypothetical protein